VSGWRDKRRVACWETTERVRPTDAARALAVELYRERLDELFR